MTTNKMLFLPILLVKPWQQIKIPLELLTIVKMCLVQAQVGFDKVFIFRTFPQIQDIFIHCRYFLLKYRLTFINPLFLRLNFIRQKGRIKSWDFEESKFLKNKFLYLATLPQFYSHFYFFNNSPLFAKNDEKQKLCDSVL